MFSLSSLVGSSRPERGLEFTPIGRRNRSNSAASSRPAPDAPFDPSFDQTSDSSDTLHSLSIDGASPGRRIPFPEAMRAPETSSRLKSLLGSGSSSIHDLQAENKQLSADNYNLKVEVATLTKILKQTPPEFHELASENVLLKQEILKLSNELPQSSSSPKAIATSAKELLLQKELEEKEHQINSLEQRVKLAQTQFRTLPELLQQLEFLKGENQKLIRGLESAKRDYSPGKLGDLEAENNALKTELHKLRSKALEVPQDAQAQLDRAELQARAQSRQIDELTAELRAKSAEVRAKEMELERFRNTARAESPSLALRNDLSKLEELKEQNLDLKHQNAELGLQLKIMTLQNEEQRRETSRLTHDLDHLSRSRTSEGNRKLESTLSELRQVQSDLRQKDRVIRDLQEERNGEVSRMQAKLESLRRDIQAKDDEEMQLKAQIRTLLSERNDGTSLTSVQHFETRLNQMKQTEDRLSRENRSLKDENAALQDELYRIDVSKRSEQSAQHYAEVSELSDKLAFYEKEYDLLQDAMEEVEHEKEHFKEQSARSEDDRAQLQVELESAKSKLRRLEIQEAQKVNESAIFELEEAHRKRSQAEQRRMAAQNEALTLKISELESKLAQNTSTNESEELRRSLARLQIQVSEKDASLAEKDRSFERVQRSIREKEDLIEALEARIRDLSFGLSRGESAMRTEYEYQIRALELENEKLRDMKHESERLKDLKYENERLRELNLESEKLRELKLDNDRLRTLEAQRSIHEESDKYRYESEWRQKEELQRMQYELDKLRHVQSEVELLRKEQAENARIQRELQDEIRFYKTKLDTLMESESTVQPVIALLESEVDNYRQLNKELHEKLDQLREKHEAANLAKLQREKTEISAENEQERKAMMQELQVANQRLYEEKSRAQKTIDVLEEEKVRAQKTINALEEEYRSVKAEKGRLEARSKSLGQELNKTSRHCTRLANRIHEMDMAKTEEASSESKRKMEQIQGEVEQLSRSLAASKISAKADHKTQKDRAKVEARVLRNESNFFKAKLFDINLKCNDLALMNTFMVNAIKSSDKHMKNDLVKMAQCGIYPDYHATHAKPKLSMKLLATFVLSMVKMKRRAEKAKVRAHKMSQLRAEIDRDRITLVAEARS